MRKRTIRKEEREKTKQNLNKGLIYGIDFFHWSKNKLHVHHQHSHGCRYRGE